ncbi:TetR/AcrR family transcriptional regulator [Nocardiopsis gilva YIM 90087]|uniref:TetR/AcrR family transcriptional regulator n=1 Tax=Nocardiopsis gilva YIM 90087 TaxID=1235441 RepID=A0A223S1R9_9ACTN|nr:TetR family transcriptional regulator [Nocardiopsis gilva]ASU82058.1 TetR/AcrR family transcriptional regulator [Nocardiopsis gilva YIM 90087]
MTRSSDATRKSLLEAARAEFAAQGLAGARVDRIADRAGINKERIYRYFGGKDGLFDAVMAAALQDFAEVVALPAHGGDIGEYVGRLYDHHQRHPEMVRLLLWEGLDDRGPTEGHAEHYRRRKEALAAGLGRAADAEVGRVMLTLCGLANWPNSVPQVARMLLGDEAPDTPDGRARMRAFLVSFARAAVERDTAEGDIAVPDGREGGSSQEVDRQAVNGLTDGGVDTAADDLRRALAEADAARDRLISAMRAEHDGGRGTSANRLARKVDGLMSRPLVLRALAGGDHVEQGVEDGA